MPLTAAQLEFRRTRISASDVSVILGLNPWKTPADLWLEKTQDIEPLEENDAMWLGNVAESPLIDWCAKSLGVLADRELGTVAHPDNDWLCATPDAGIAGQNRGIEAKTAGESRGFVESDKWGDADTDEVPAEYWCQCQIQMAVMGWNAVYLAAWVTGRGRVRYFIARDNARIADMISLAHEWYLRHIVGGERPEDSLPDYDTIKRVRREPGNVGVVDVAVADRYDKASEQHKFWEKEYKAAKAAMAYAAPGCDGFVAGNRAYSYLTQSRRGIDIERLWADFPEAAEACAKVSYFPVLRASKARKGKAA